MTSDEIRSAVLELADKHLFPYEIQSKPHGDELIPEFCPFCQRLFWRMAVLTKRVWSDW